jgi:hypothetical protein
MKLSEYIELRLSCTRGFYCDRFMQTDGCFFQVYNIRVRRRRGGARCDRIQVRTRQETTGQRYDWPRQLVQLRGPMCPSGDSQRVLLSPRGPCLRIVPSLPRRRSLLHSSCDRHEPRPGSPSILLDIGTGEWQLLCGESIVYIRWLIRQ